MLSQELIQDAIDKGAKSQQSLKRDGNLIWPMVFDDVTADMRLAWEEPFGTIDNSVEFFSSRFKNVGTKQDFAEDEAI